MGHAGRTSVPAIPKRRPLDDCTQILFCLHAMAVAATSSVDAVIQTERLKFPSMGSECE